MARYIDATNAINLLSLFYNYTDAERFELALAISAVPTADVVERKKGKWITDKYGNVLCSECGYCAPQIMTGCIVNRHLDYDKSNFCWHCGSDNREESDNG